MPSKRALTIVFILSFPIFANAQCSSSPPQLSQPYVHPPTQCGVSNYTLQYTFNGSGTIIAGTYSPRGTCGGGYYTCTNSYVGIFPVYGLMQSRVIPDSTGVWTIFWDSTEYEDYVLNACPSNSCNPNGLYSDSQDPPVYYVNEIQERVLECPK